MTRRTVTVTGGGENLYEISGSDGAFNVYKVDVGFISNDRKKIGTTRSLEDALALIRSHSGRQIEEIS